MTAAPRRLKNTAHADAQRDRILIAARESFVRYGFHAASMTLIAEAAGVSVGLIYRYFENKRAIILAIIEQQLEENRGRIGLLKAAPDFALAVFQIFDNWRRNQVGMADCVLAAEITAEASRDPAILGALRASEQELRTWFCAWLTDSVAVGGKGLPVEVAQQRAISLQCFMDGLSMRLISEPDIAPTVLESMITHFIDALFNDV
ncbi:MAG: TetR/AcrR family transcriptional regulator [Herbaspirillum sp.]